MATDKEKFVFDSFALMTEGVGDSSRHLKPNMEELDRRFNVISPRLDDVVAHYPEGVSVFVNAADQTKHALEGESRFVDIQLHSPGLSIEFLESEGRVDVLRKHKMMFARLHQPDALDVALTKLSLRDQSFGHKKIYKAAITKILLGVITKFAGGLWMSEIPMCGVKRWMSFQYQACLPKNSQRS